MEVFENIMRIAYLGPGGSYTEMAKDIFLEKYGIRLIEEPLSTIRQVIDFVDENPLTIGVVPVENSIEGTVRETVDCLIKTKNDKIRFLSEVIIPIKHCLLSRTTEIYSISGVISHPQAIAQCQNFIHEKLPMNIEIIKATSTAEAARSLDRYNMTYSAIGSKKTADLYNLNIICDNINDDPSNKTIFALIGDLELLKTENDKTSFAFSTENKPGALLDVLEIFRKYDINLSYIDSRPSKTKFGEYTFFVEFDGHVEDEKIKGAIDEIKKFVKFYRFVGSYEKTDLSE